MTSTSLHTVSLTPAQRYALVYYFRDHAPEEQHPEDWSKTDAEDVEILVEDGQLRIDGCYLHSDGEWATYPDSGAK